MNKVELRGIVRGKPYYVENPLITLKFRLVVYQAESLEVIVEVNGALAKKYKDLKHGDCMIIIGKLFERRKKLEIRALQMVDMKDTKIDFAMEGVELELIDDDFLEF